MSHEKTNKTKKWQKIGLASMISFGFSKVSSWKSSREAELRQTDLQQRLEQIGASDEDLEKTSQELMNLRAIEEIRAEWGEKLVELRQIYKAKNQIVRVEEIERALGQLGIVLLDQEKVSEGSSEELRIVDQKEARESELRKSPPSNVFRIMHDASKNIGLQEMIGVERINKIYDTIIMHDIQEMIIFFTFFFRYFSFFRRFFWIPI